MFRAHTPETCRAKNTSIKLSRCIKLAFHIISCYTILILIFSNTQHWSILVQTLDFRTKKENLNFLKDYWYLLHSYKVMNFTTILDMSNYFTFFQKQSFGNWICFLNRIIVMKVSDPCGPVTKNEYRSVNRKKNRSKLSEYVFRQPHISSQWHTNTTSTDPEGK